MLIIDLFTRNAVWVPGDRDNEPRLKRQKTREEKERDSHNAHILRELEIVPGSQGGLNNNRQKTKG